MTTTALTVGVTCAMAAAFFAGAATCYWWQTREQRAERRRQQRDAHDARAFGALNDYEFLMGNGERERDPLAGSTPATHRERDTRERPDQFRG